MEKRFTEVQKLAIIGLLIALDVILTRFLSFQLPFSRIGFGFLPVAITGMLFGPISAIIAGIAGDLIGMAVFPTAAYFVGFTVSAGLRGLIYGVTLNRQPLKLGNIILATALVSVIITVCLDTTWLHIILGKGYLFLLPARLTQAVTMMVVQTITISLVYKSIVRKAVSLA